MLVCYLMAQLALRDALVKPAQRGGANWLHVEADHFLQILSWVGVSSFSDWDGIVRDFGLPYAEAALRSELDRHEASCIEARSPYALMSAWREVLASRNQAALPVKLLEQRDNRGSAAPPAAVKTVAAVVMPVEQNSPAIPSSGGAVPGWEHVDEPLVDPAIAVAPADPSAADVNPLIAAQGVGRVRPAPGPRKGVKRPGVGADATVAFADMKMTVKQKTVLAIASDPVQTDEAVQDLRDKMLAERTWASHSSEILLYVGFCAKNGIDPPWPVTRDSLEKFVALMAKAAYAPGSIVQYIGAVLRQMVLMHFYVEPGLLQWRRYLVQAAKRDGGDAHRMLPISYVMLAGIREFILQASCFRLVLQIFLYRMAVITWFFVMRIDETLGATDTRGLGRDAFAFDHANRSVTISLYVTKMNQEGVRCRRTHFCVCDDDSQRSDMDRLLPVCPYCAAFAVCVDNDKVSDDSSAPLRPDDVHDKAPKSEHMLKLLRAMLEKFADKFPEFGLDLKTAEGRNLYGTQSLRRGAAQALVEAGWSIDDVKFFGRWLSDAIELYLLQVPMRSYGQDVAASMTRMKKMSGADAVVPPKGHAAVGEVTFEPERVCARAILGVGDRIKLLLPDLLMESVSQQVAHDLDDELKSTVNSGYFTGQIMAILPAASQIVFDLPLVFHQSIVNEFSDFRDLHARKHEDRCIVLEFPAQVPVEHKYLVVCLLQISFTIVKSARA